MIKAFSAIAAAGFVAAALTVLPGFAPQVEASVPQALAKGDRLDVRTVGKDCSQQAWPNFEASCLRTAGAKAVVREARLVTADHTLYCGPVLRHSAEPIQAANFRSAVAF